MQILTFKGGLCSAWAMALLYDWIEVNKGIEIRPLVYAALVVFIVSLFACFRENKETTEEEA